MIHAKRVFNLDEKHRFNLTKKDIIDSIELLKNNNLKEKKPISNNPLEMMYL